MPNPVLELSERLKAKKAEGQALIDKTREENRAFTDDERTQLDAITKEAAGIRGDIDRLISFGDLNAAKPFGKIGLTEPEKQEYSIVTAMRNKLDGKFEGTYEHEVSVATEKKLGKSARGILVPDDILEHRETRTTGGSTQLVGTTGIGGYLVATDLSSSIIDLLRNRLVCQALGATTLTGLVGNVAIPTITADPTAYWVAEDTDPTVSHFHTGQLALSPKDLAGADIISRKLLLQSSISVENFVRADLARILAIEIDRAAIAGTGTGEPFGIINTTGVNTQAMSATTNANANPSWSTLVGFEKEISLDNADFGTIGWAINPATRAFCKITPKSTVMTAGFLMDPDGSINGYKALVSNQVPNALSVKAASASAIVFGNWSMLMLAFWSGVDILVDPYTQGLSGAVRVIAHQDVDFGVRQPTAFCVSTDVDFD